MPQTGEVTVVGVTPARERSRRRRLFDAFEHAYPVRFEGRDAGAVGGLDALVCFPSASHHHRPPAHLPCLRYRGEEREGAVVREVSLAEHPALARPLWGSRLTETHAGECSAGVLERGDVLASVAGRSAWRLQTARGVAHHEVSVAPAELTERDALRSRLAPLRCLAVLALTQFIRNVTADRAWETPGIRSAFVIDDPNLRRPTYGHIKYAELAASAVALDYHVSIAMVPLDGRFSHGDAVRLFRRHARNLSLCIHGNDHSRDELWRPRSLAESRVPAAQAIRRSIAFERRTGLTVDRVMVAPHERLGESAADALLACGFEGFSSSRPYPWLDSAHDLPWLSRPADDSSLVGWRSAELVGTGLPALLRLDFGHPREELVIRAFLGQPLIMYGHDDLLRGGTGELERAVGEIGRLGDVRWQSLAGIARSSVATRRRGSALQVRMLGRRVSFCVPEGVDELLVDTHLVCKSPSTRLRAIGPVRCEQQDGTTEGTRMVVERSGRIELVLDRELDPLTVPAPPPSLRSIARRIATEGRDRSRPKLSRTVRSGNA
jgi:hypothetical protein